MQAVLDHALEQYRRRSFSEQANAAYQALKENRSAWRKEQAERAAWDGTLQDGFETE